MNVSKDFKSLYAWAREGYEIVAMIAEQRLQPDVREAVTILLGATAFIEASMWADQVRGKETAAWHYVNIPIDEDAYDSDRHCPKQQCVVAQIERFRNVLADKAADARKRQNALKYLIHFVADLHQPLHAGDNHDRGGNDVQVEFLGQTINPYNHKAWNLHAVWDSGILEAHERNAHHYAERLNLWLCSQTGFPKTAQWWTGRWSHIASRRNTRMYFLRIASGRKLLPNQRTSGRQTVGQGRCKTRKNLDRSPGKELTRCPSPVNCRFADSPPNTAYIYL